MSALYPLGPKKPALRHQDGLGMLTRRVYFHMVRSAGRLLLPFDATVEQYVVLMYLAEENGLTQQELVRRCASDPRTMGKMLDLLVAKGWTRREHHETDRRAWQIVLTAKGRRVKDQMDEALVPLRERPDRILGEADTQVLKNLLGRLLDALDPARWLPANGHSESTRTVRKRRATSSKPNH